MCGIAGYVRRAGLLGEHVLREMVARVRHRGPDGDGFWSDPAAGAALGHTRLKIQDLTEAAHQPMRTEDGCLTLVFNGEIYNFPALREELHGAGVAVRSTGDTEVLLRLCEQDIRSGGRNGGSGEWDGRLTFLPRLNGMFAFALWHGPTRTLTLVRDRTGVKPLLYAEIDGGLAFASEMVAIRPAVSGLTIDPAAVMELLSLGFIAAPRTIFTAVKKLPPGHLLRWRAAAMSDVGCRMSDVTAPHPTSDIPHPTSNTTVERWAPQFPALPATMQFEDGCQRLRDLMVSAVGDRLLADVPVGLFLSGGIDSAIVTACAAKAASGRVKTFSIGFPDHPFYDETRYARAVAEMHGTKHTSIPVSLDDVRNAIPTAQAHLGEPFADSSALPTYLLSQMTRQHVTVALSGDGADELFAGYSRYVAANLIERFGWFTQTPLYGLSRRLIERLPGKRETKLGGKFSQLKRAIRAMDPDPRHRYANWMRTADDRTLGRLLHDAAQLPAVLNHIVNLLWAHRGEPKEDVDLNRHLQTEWRLSLPDDMLTKVDLMSMAHGLEVRSPFLDHRVVDFVMPLDWRWKLHGWRKKHLLVEAFKRDLPPLLHNRPKKGFEVPVGVWLRGPLNGFARDLIENDRLFFGRLLSREGALKTLDDHTAGRADHNFHLWALVSLLSWQQQHAADVPLGEEKLKTES